jgi:hypothetical protein
MDLKRLAGKARELVDKRGGPEALKQDAEELKRIATGPGKATDKAKAAFEAVKDPGRSGSEDSTERTSAEPSSRGGAGGPRRTSDRAGGERRGDGGRRN